MKYLVDNINNYKNIDLNVLKIYKMKKINKYYSYKDILRSFVGEMLLIKGLNDFYNIDYNDVNIVLNDFGKPYIENNNIYYNISHSNDYVIVAFSNNEIGVDIQYIYGDLNTKKIFCNDDEIKYIGNDINKLFDVYTFKESYIKMLGIDLLCIKDVNFSGNYNVYD